jgi:glycerate-2-kinase
MSAPLRRIRLHAARPQGVNEPTPEGVAGAEEMLRLLNRAGPDDVAVCLLSGGGSAMLPAPVEGVSLADKLAVTKLLHRSGATIDEMNCVRKHLSRVKGGRLAEAFRGKQLISLKAEELGYLVLDLGSFVEGETRHVATALAGVVRSIRHNAIPLKPPACVLLGGETTVTLGSEPGKGGRNQEFALATLAKLGAVGMTGVTVLSAGTDGEDGPTDAAGAVADAATLTEVNARRLWVDDYLRRHDAYNLFDRAGGLIRSGLTGTNVMDVRVILVSHTHCG